MSGQSFQLFSCRWAWCRSSFSNNAELIHHVVHDHVLHAIPIRRRDISLIQRAEEGNGGSLGVSELMVGMYSYSSQEPVHHKSVALPQEPSSSLPSPPVSSPALHSPYPLPYSPIHALSPNPEQRENPGPTRSGDISRQNSPDLSPSEPLQGHNPLARTFASLSSPEPGPSPCSFEVPDSPSFSSLVVPLSKASSASSASQNSVEAQLTPMQDSNDVDQDDDLPYHSPNALLSQPPEFPFHFHDHPRGSTSKVLHSIQTGLDPSAAVPLSPSSSVSSPIFAVSTPVRQNWYQPSLKLKQRSTYNDKNSDPPPLKKEEALVSPTKSFRSGTLQIVPSLSEEYPAESKHGVNGQNNLATRFHSPHDVFSASSQDSSDLSETHSYPALQTQAPYQSQILTPL